MDRTLKNKEGDMSVSKYFDTKFLELYLERVKVHWFSLYPQIIEAMGDIQGSRVLDLGCGSGHLTVKLSSLGVTVIGVDISPAWIQYCREQHGERKKLRFYEANGTNLSRWEDSTFDQIVISMVILNVETADEVERIFKEVSRVLKPGGMMIFSDLHPLCLMAGKMPTRSIERDDDFSYFRNGDIYTAVVEAGEENISFSNRHWTLGWLTSIFNQCGMSITRIIEPHYNNNASEKLKGYKIPEYILLVCERQERR